MTIVQSTLEAERGLENIAKFIARDNPVRAVTFLDELMTAVINRLSVFPVSCEVVNAELDTRCYVFNSYNIYYRYDEPEDIVTIFHILNSAVSTNSALRLI